MSAINPESPLRFAVAEPPPFGLPQEIAPGILWLRLPLPYALDHVNIYLFEERSGWAVFDTGLGDEPSRAAWEKVLSGPLGGRPITRLVVSHYHPDHVGLAGWLDDRFAPALAMPRSEYLFSRLLQSVPTRSRAEDLVFYRRAGLAADEVAHVLRRGKSYLERTTGLAPSYQPLRDGDALELGGRSWRVLTGGGHALDQAMLWCEADGLFLSADQVLARISPNVSVLEVEPNADPLRQYLESLDAIRGSISSEALLLPGHGLPFTGLHARIDQLIQHHEHRCELILAACRDVAWTCREIVPVLFHRALDAHQLGFAIGEALAHVNFLVHAGRLEAAAESDGAVRYRSR